MSVVKDHSLDEFAAFCNSRPSLEEYIAYCKATWRTDYRAIYLEAIPGLAAYLHLAQWILQKHGKVRWQEDSQYSWEYCSQEKRLCYFLQDSMHLNFGKYMQSLADQISEDVINLWADGELHGKLVTLFRNHSLQTSIH